MTLQKWIEMMYDLGGKVPFELDLYHDEAYHNEATMSDVTPDMLTEAGKKHFEAVMNATVEKHQARGANWYGVVVSGATVEQVEELQWSHSGYCTEEEWNEYFKG